MAGTADGSLKRKEADRSEMRKTMVSLMDLTSLGDADTEDTIADLVSKADSPLGKVAALCVFSKFVKAAKAGFGGEVATVVNFPKGDSSVEEVEEEIRVALANQADEIDLVIPWKEYVEHGSSAKACALVSAARALIPEDKVLKVILESGALEKEELIRAAARDAIRGGADFVKTSTGKVKVGATPAAARVILEEIREATAQQGGAEKEGDDTKVEEKPKKACKVVGFKASGGIRSYDDALPYCEMATEILGAEFLAPKTFRFGVSGLLKNLVEEAEDEPDAKRKKVPEEEETKAPAEVETY